MMETPSTFGAAIYQMLLEARDSYEKETRAEMRYPFYRSVSVKCDDEVRPAFSRELSLIGIGLLHRAELPLEDVLVTIPTEEAFSVCVRTRILWCRPLGEGWFISGGEFTGFSATSD